MLYLGCPQWGSQHWRGRFFSRHCKAADMLHEYSQIFNSVEGNTSFYADPSPATVQTWHDAVPDTFRFTFKLPKRFSHESGLQPDPQAVLAWCQLFEPLFAKIGMLILQLPASVTPLQLPQVAALLAQLPKDLPLGIEVRHPAFFQKGEAERQFNRYLLDHSINRIIMDTRPLFSEPATTPAIIDAQRKKPRVPVNVIATSSAPMLRFVGCSTLVDNRAFYAPWLNKIRQWLDEGKTPYVFFHTADNFDSPLLARQFIHDLGYSHQVLAPFPAEQESVQNSLF
ncbi:DUF72 domain-containing protein [Pseudoalteromonas fenneropenaei]|uniref:DUF72 domain-containing protein n=1 Tax=Pseudoalteromonas fenneropenaei TaxID=1737459 RepID=A0ABV7CMZ7_9GAMM